MPTPPPHLADPQLTYLADDGKDAYVGAVLRGFHDDGTDTALWVPQKKALEASRSFGFTVGERAPGEPWWVATCSAYSRTMSVPGGAMVPTAAVTVVTVTPSYRRRGMLRAMMEHQLADVHKRREPLALLWASESLIYGRFGYGQATPRITISGQTKDTTFLPGVEVGSGSVGEVGESEWLEAVVPLRERLITERPGALNRDEDWWTYTVYDPAPWRHGASPLRFVLHYAGDGAVDGFAVFRVKNGDDGAEVRVVEVEAVGPPAYAALWRFLLDLDLVRSFSRHHAPVDEPLRYLVADPRRIKTELSDGTYLRVVDARAAIGRRTYAAEVDLTLEVRDPLFAHNDGTFRLRTDAKGGSLSPSRKKTADVSLGIRELGSIYLGGISVLALHDAGLIRGADRAAVRALAAAFSVERAPFCPDFF